MRDFYSFRNDRFKLAVFACYSVSDFMVFKICIYLKERSQNFPFVYNHQLEILDFCLIKFCVNLIVKVFNCIFIQLYLSGTFYHRITENGGSCVQITRFVEQVSRHQGSRAKLLAVNQTAVSRDWTSAHSGVLTCVFR